MSEANYRFQGKGSCNRECGICLTMVFKEEHSLANQLEDSFSALLRIHPVFTFSLHQSSSWDSEWSPLPLGHQVCKFFCVYLSAGSARNTSTQNSNITNQISNINKVRELKLHMRKISNDMEEICGILNVYMYEDLNYR